MAKPALLVSYAKRQQAKAKMAPYGSKPYTIGEKAYRFRQLILWGAVLLAIGVDLKVPHHGMALIEGLALVWLLEPIPRLALRRYWRHQELQQMKTRYR